MTTANTPSTDDSFHVAITGAAGFIGSRTLYRFQQAHPSWTFTALDNFYLGTVRSVGETPIEHVDIRNRTQLESALDDADAICHLAAISGVDDCAERSDLAHDVNITGTNNIAWHCRKHGTALVFPFSMAVLGDPTQFPITVDDPRAPMNWYGRTKLLGERAVEAFADGAFPAHLFLKSNLYGEHTVDGQRVSKNTVINFFINRALSGEPLTVYEPGTQSRNYIHVDDVASAYVRSVEQLKHQLNAGVTGVSKYEIASNEDPSVMEVATLVQSIAASELNRDIEISLVENPRSGETLVDEFAVDISRARTELGWKPTHTVESSIQRLLEVKSGSNS